MTDLGFGPVVRPVDGDVIYGLATYISADERGNLEDEGVRDAYVHVIGRDQHALIISNDALNESATAGWAITAPIDTTGASPDILVTVPITRPIDGVIRLDSITSVRKDRVGELTGRIDPDTLDQVAIALRAALDL